VETNLAVIRSSQGLGSPSAYCDVVLYSLDIEERQGLTDLEKSRLARLAGLVDVFRNTRPLAHGAREIELLLYRCNTEGFYVLGLDKWADEISLSRDPDAIGTLAFFAGDRHASMEGEQQRLAKIISRSIVRSVISSEDVPGLIEFSLEGVLRARPSAERVAHVKELIDILRDRFGQSSAFACVNGALPFIFDFEPWWLQSLPLDTTLEDLIGILPDLRELVDGNGSGTGM
jgi:hypothetical protein